MDSKQTNIAVAGIFGRRDTARGLDVIGHVEKYLAGRGIATKCRPLALGEYFQPELADVGDIDLAIAVGGDGTFLNVARALAGGPAPIIGINLGRRGFLTDVSVDEIHESLGSVLDGRYEIEKRTLIKAEVRSPNIGGESISHALNDIVVHKTNLGRLLECEITVDGEFMAILRADGIIVAAPTGSTAYALSAGGPILHPALAALELIPVSPQALGIRPVVVSDSSQIEIRLIDVESKQCSLIADGHIRRQLSGDETIVLRRSHLGVDLIRIEGHTFFNTLRQKLGWGG